MDLELVWFVLNKFFKLKNNEFYNSIGRVNYNFVSNDYFELLILNTENQRMTYTLESQVYLKETRDLLSAMDFKPDGSGCFVFENREQVESVLIEKEKEIPQVVVDFLNQINEQPIELTVSSAPNKKRSKK